MSMASRKRKKIIPVVKNKRVAYNYLFNCRDNDNTAVVGASVLLDIRPFKHDEEILFEDAKEPSVKGCYLSDVFSMSFDPEKMLVIQKNPNTEKLFCDAYGWDHIGASAFDFALEIITGKASDYVALPDDFKDLPIQEPINVSQFEFMAFLKAHRDDFDIADNKPAQVSGICFHDAPPTYYIIDHYYANDHMDYCRIVKSSMGKFDLARLLMAVQFYFEDTVDKSADPAPDEVVSLLDKYYGCEAVDKEDFRNNIGRVLDLVSELDCASYEEYVFEEDGEFREGKFAYLDMYEIREHMCGPGRPERLYKEWLTQEIMNVIRKFHKGGI